MLSQDTAVDLKLALTVKTRTDRYVPTGRVIGTGQDDTRVARDSTHIGVRNQGATLLLQLGGNQKQVKEGGGGREGSTSGAKVTVPPVPIVVPPSPFSSLRESRRGRTAGGVAAGRGSADGGWAPGASCGGGTVGDACWDVPMARGSWVDQMSEMSLSGRDSIPQEGGRNARVRRAVRISSLVAQEVRVCVCVCVYACVWVCVFVRASFILNNICILHFNKGHFLWSSCLQRAG